MGSICCTSFYIWIGEGISLIWTQSRGTKCQFPQWYNTIRSFIHRHIHCKFDNFFKVNGRLISSVYHVVVHFNHWDKSLFYWCSLQCCCSLKWETENLMQSNLCEKYNQVTLNGLGFVHLSQMQKSTGDSQTKPWQNFSSSSAAHKHYLLIAEAIRKLCLTARRCNTSQRGALPQRPFCTQHK